jgi:flagellar export protein FliJ
MARDTLSTLIRLAGTEVDEARRVLQAFLAEEDQWRAALADLSEEVERESAMAKTEPAYAAPFGLFMARAKERREGMEARLRELKPKIDAARDALAEAFAGQKRYEIAKQNLDAAAAREAARREGLELDEQGLNAYRRKGR